MKKLERVHIISLSRLKGFGYTHLQMGIRYFGSVSGMINAKQSNWDKIFPKIDRSGLNAISPKEKCVVIVDNDYPEQLREIPSPPLVLYYRGDWGILKSKLVSVVGTRSCTTYGERVTSNLIQKVGQRGYGFVSGMALGVDTIVHETALESGFNTVAVLPSSIDYPEPPRNARLALEIEKNGLVISEYDSKRDWNKAVYARRNRIIAGLSMITIVTEAPIKSGALITANLAFDYNREVFACPGNIYSTKSSGSNWLIQNNKAHLLDCDFNIEGESQINTRNEHILNLSKNEIQVIDLLESEPLTIEEIQKYVSMSAQSLRQVLLGLELKQLICLNSSGKYIMNFIKQ